MNDSMIRIQVLVENRADQRGLLGEHGLAYSIHRDGHCLLFDTGQGMALDNNAHVLGVDLEPVEAIALSHGHYDHGGGLRFFAKQRVPPIVYAHPAAFLPKYAKKQNNTYYSVGFVSMEGLALSQFSERIVPILDPKEMMEGIWLTGPVPRLNDFEAKSEGFFLDNRGERVDDLLDDQSLYFMTEDGVVVLLGCAHSGVINTLQYIQSLTGTCLIHHVIGGMHLLHASSEQINWTIAAMLEMGVSFVSPCHCTGERAARALYHAFGDRYKVCMTGRAFSFEIV